MYMVTIEILSKSNLEWFYIVAITATVFLKGTLWKSLV